MNAGGIAQWLVDHPGSTVAEITGAMVRDGVVDPEAGGHAIVRLAVETLEDHGAVYAVRDRFEAPRWYATHGHRGAHGATGARREAS